MWQLRFFGIVVRIVLRCLHSRTVADAGGSCGTSLPSRGVGAVWVHACVESCRYAKKYSGGGDRTDIPSLLLNKWSDIEVRAKFEALAGPISHNSAQNSLEIPPRLDIDKWFLSGSADLVQSGSTKGGCRRAGGRITTICRRRSRRQTARNVTLACTCILSRPSRKYQGFALGSG